MATRLGAVAVVRGPDAQGDEALAGLSTLALVDEKSGGLLPKKAGGSAFAGNILERAASLGSRERPLDVALLDL